MCLIPITNHIAVHKCKQHLLYNKSGHIFQLFLSSRERIIISRRNSYVTCQHNFTTQMCYCSSNSHLIVFVLCCHLHKAVAHLNHFGTQYSPHHGLNKLLEQEISQKGAGLR